MQLFEHEGITPGIRRAFVVYLASHNRPIHEVLYPAMRDIGKKHTHRASREHDPASGAAEAEGGSEGLRW